MAMEFVEQRGPDVHCAHTEMVPLLKLIPNPRNPNMHPTKQIELLAKIIAIQGWRAPITVSKRSGFIVRGHGRYAAAKILELDTVPVDHQDYESEAAEWADLVADNRISELSQMDRVLLREVLGEIDTGNIDMDITGFDEGALEILMTWTPDDSNLPQDLPKPGIAGDDDTMGKLILVYANDDERVRWLGLLGITGDKTQIVFSLADIDDPDTGEAPV